MDTEELLSILKTAMAGDFIAVLVAIAILLVGIAIYVFISLRRK